MSRTITIALSAVLALGLAMPVLAQDNFPDVPENHWAYQAIATLKKDGILVGYPDNMFHGSRPATRYEMAEAINAAYQNLKSITSGLNSQIDAINQKLGSSSGTGSGDLDDLRSQLKDLKSEVDGMQSYGQDIDDLKKLTSSFEKELTAMGVDVKSMKDELDSLDSRVSKLEKAKLPFDVHGEVDAAVFAGYASSGTYGITTTGQPVGQGRGGFAGAPVGVTKDLTVLHQANIAITSNDDGPTTFKIVGTAGNVEGNNGSLSYPNVGAQFNDAGASRLYFQTFEIGFKAKLGGLAFNGRVGRIGYKVSPYIFQRANVNPYFHNDYLSNGDYDVDGGALSFGIGKGNFTIVAGRTSSQVDNTGANFMPLGAGLTRAPFVKGFSQPGGIMQGALPIDQMAGATLNIPIGSLGSVNLAYLFLDSNTTIAVGGSQADRVSDFGGTLNLNFGKFKFDGGYTRTPLQYNTSKVSDSNDFEYHAHLGYSAEKWGLGVGYQHIEPLFGAPGDWGRIGIWWNPTDIKGFTADGHLDLSSKLTLSGSAKFYSGIGSANSGLSTSDKINDYAADLSYALSPEATVSLGYEAAAWDLKSVAGFTGGKPLYQWYNIGFGYNLSSNTNLSILWQISDYDSKGVTGFGVFGNSTAKGGLITTQLSIKF